MHLLRDLQLMGESSALLARYATHTQPPTRQEAVHPAGRARKDGRDLPPHVRDRRRPPARHLSGPLLHRLDGPPRQEHPIDGRSLPPLFIYLSGCLLVVPVGESPPGYLECRPCRSSTRQRRSSRGGGTAALILGSADSLAGLLEGCASGALRVVAILGPQSSGKSTRGRGRPDCAQAPCSTASLARPSR